MPFDAVLGDALESHPSSTARSVLRVREAQLKGFAVNGALEGLKVIEVAAIGPVPFAAMMLSDMGAQITRIDRIPSKRGGGDAMVGVENRGRQSIAIDLKQPKGVQMALRMIENADVLLEGFRPGVMEKLGLGPEVCHALNAKLVYARMTGWGQSGPLAHAAGHDINYVALTGALHAMGPSDRPPSPPLNLVGDYGGGALMMLVGVLAALHSRQQTDQGQVIDVAMTDGVATLLAPFYSMLAQGKWQDKRQANLLDGGAHFYGAYQCADGRYISIGSIEPQFYRVLLEKCGIDVPEFQDHLNEQSWPTMREHMAKLFLSRTRDQWSELLQGTDACFAPVLDFHEAPKHAHNAARQTFVEYRGTMQPAPAPRFDRTPSIMQTYVPLVGANSAALLAQVGILQDEIAQLITTGVVYASEMP